MLWHSNPAARAWRTTAAPAEVLAFHQALDGYQPTPLTAVPALAAELGVGQVLVKDESQRLGLPAFKALGAWWAINRALQDHPDTAELVTATDGNHGRAVARMAAMLGLKAHVFIPAVVSVRSIEAIRSEGAVVTIVDDSYDAAVVAAADAATGDSLLIQDSAWPGYEVIPQYIVDGYSTLFREIDVEPDLVVVPMGVGSVAQAAVTHYRSGLAAPAVLGVEPANAACVTASLQAGKPVTVSTGHTVMAGLNCGTPSSLAWPVLRAGLDAAVTVEEAEALQAVEDLGAAGISSGASGAATLAGLRAARDRLELSTDSTVILISTEAAS
ncbi:pyridoxal-phosphate dependent enzyme [Kribbella sp. NPDC056861]|uniref:pyridoxal-phosphate dependent enzyme n=1 Tax=Kribbella sp. NPDC056861 TaxID=3154857 RepID=UPI0034221E1A